LADQYIQKVIRNGNLFQFPILNIMKSLVREIDVT
jgi:hypothetical protein